MLDPFRVDSLTIAGDDACARRDGEQRTAEGSDPQRSRTGSPIHSGLGAPLGAPGTSAVRFVQIAEEPRGSPAILLIRLFARSALRVDTDSRRVVAAAYAGGGA